MEVRTFQYVDEAWSVKQFPELDSPTTFILIFFASSYQKNPEPIKQLINHYPRSIILGCSSAGEIEGRNVLDNSISVAIMKFEKTELKFATATVTAPKKSYEAGKEIINKLDAKNLAGLFVLSEGLNINGSELSRGLNDFSLANNPIITGGLAGDGSAFLHTWIISNNKILENVIAAVGFYGNNINISHGSKGGWDIFGPERVITKSQNNKLLELDGKPALDIYMNYLGERSSELPAIGLLFPIAIRKNIHDKNKLVRTILLIDRDEKSLTFAGNIPEGHLAQLMRGNVDRLISGAEEAARTAIQLSKSNSTVKNPDIIISISCVGRKLLLGERTFEEIEAIHDLYSPDIRQIGYYSYGELSPAEGGICELHNQTMTLTCISED